MAIQPSKSSSNGMKQLRRNAVSNIAFLLLLVAGAVVIWQIVSTAIGPVTTSPTVQLYLEETFTPINDQLALALPTGVPEFTAKPSATALPLLAVYYCGNRDNPGEICSPKFGPTPTSAPLLRCDDPRLIGGEDCFWPTPTPSQPPELFWQ